MRDHHLFRAMLTVERPTVEQYENFAQYIVDAHSWYKHLPLLKGTEFTVFLNPTAGGDFDESNPRRHYSWSTTKEYRRRFGYLDFASFEDSGPDVENSRVTPFDEELHWRFSFRMYPYVRISSWGIFLRAQHADIQKMKRGMVHPEGVSEFIFSVDQVAFLEHQLTEHDCQMIRESKEPLSDLAQKYVGLRDRVDETHNALVAAEKRKISEALKELQNWLKSEDESFRLLSSGD